MSTNFTFEATINGTTKTLVYNDYRFMLLTEKLTGLSEMALKFYNIKVLHGQLRLYDGLKNNSKNDITKSMNMVKNGYKLALEHEKISEELYNKIINVVEKYFKDIAKPVTNYFKDVFGDDFVPVIRRNIPKSPKRAKKCSSESDAEKEDRFAYTPSDTTPVITPEKVVTKSPDKSSNTSSDKPKTLNISSLRGSISLLRAEI
jgi:hypothetical protein